MCQVDCLEGTLRCTYLRRCFKVALTTPIISTVTLSQNLKLQLILNPSKRLPESKPKT